MRALADFMNAALAVFAFIGGVAFVVIIALVAVIVGNGAVLLGILLGLAALKYIFA